MSKTTRSTHTCTINQLRPALARGIREYFQAHELGDPETEIQSCCETLTERKSTGGLLDLLDPGKDRTTYTGLVLTARELVWAFADEGGEAHVVGADLVYINAQMTVSLFSKEVGLQVAGLIGGSKGNVRGVIGLGPEPDAQQFCEAVGAAILTANPQVKRKWPAWMGGSKE